MPNISEGGDDLGGPCLASRMRLTGQALVGHTFGSVADQARGSAKPAITTKCSTAPTTVQA